MLLRGCYTCVLTQKLTQNYHLHPNFTRSLTILRFGGALSLIKMTGPTRPFMYAFFLISTFSFVLRDHFDIHVYITAHCTRNPCENGGHCTILAKEPYYWCDCRIKYGGPNARDYNCTHGKFCLFLSLFVVRLFSHIFSMFVVLLIT